MNMAKGETEKRMVEAKVALVNNLALPNDESSVRSYIEHHLVEVDDEYWVTVFGESKPSISVVASKMVIHPFWYEEALDGEADLDRVDFTLPDNEDDAVTNYLLCVEYSEEGQLEGISMES